MAVVFTFIIDKLFWHVQFSVERIIGVICVIGGAFLMLLLYPKEDLQIHKK
jgi:drug/metabolite transporter (DMT)-like permease